MEKINKSEEFLDNLRKKGKVKKMDASTHDTSFMEKVKADFLRKNAASEESASKLIVNGQKI